MINTWTTDLAECKIARSCDFATTQSEIIDLKKECKQIQKLADAVSLCDGGDAKWDVFLDRIPQKFKEFTTDIESVELMSKDVEQNFGALLTEWGENPKLPTKDFFGPLCDFMDAYEKEVKELKAVEDKKAAEEEKKSKLKEKDASARASVDPD